MKANELRLANWINLKGNIQVWHIDIDDIDRVNYIGIDKYEPIPLTEEWLLKFGFEKVGDTYMLKITKLIYHCCYVRYVDDIWWFLSRKGATYDFKFNNVHQLQNLYFALTGQELEIK